MKGTGAIFKAIVVSLAATIIASAVNAPCPEGTRVQSITVWSGWWLDGLIMRCTGDSEDQIIPPEFIDNPGGDEEADICADTAGVKSMDWNIQNSFAGMVYLTITCLDDSSYRFADGRSFRSWDVDGKRTISCGEGEYVQGLTYNAVYPNQGYTYYLNNLDFICSSSELDDEGTN